MHRLRYTLSLLEIVCLCSVGLAGSKIYPDFNQPQTSLHVRYSDSLILAPRDTILTRYYGDSLISPTKVHSRSSWVMPVNPTTFGFFWAETSSTAFGGAQENVFRRNISLTQTSFTQGASQKLYSNIDTISSYLRAAMGRSTFLATIVTGGFDSLVAMTDSTSLTVSKNTTPLGSLAYAGNDTFIVIQKIDNLKLVTRKYLAAKRSLVQKSLDTIATGIIAPPRSEAFMNPSLAFDSVNHTMLALYTRKVSISGVLSKQLEFKFMRSNCQMLDSGLVRNGVNETLFDFYTEDAPVVCFAPNRFAAATWRADSLLMYVFSWNGISLVPSRIPVHVGDSLHFASIATNGSYVIVGSKADLNKDNKREIAVWRFVVLNGEVQTTPDLTLSFSDPSRALTITERFKADVSLAIDSTGDIAATWQGSSSAWAAIYAKRGILEPLGFFESKVDSLPFASGDSIGYLPTLIQSGNGGFGNISDSIQIGSSSNILNTAAWGPWVNAADSMVLATSGKTSSMYYRYKVALSRNTRDSLFSPVAQAVTIRWNAKPFLESIDSLIYDGSVKRTISFGDTIKLFARKDSITMFIGFHDADTNDAVTLTGLVYIPKTAQATATAASQHAMLSFAPFDTKDTLYASKLSLTDTRGWDAVEKTLHFITRNSAPAINASVKVDTNRSGVEVTVPLSGSERFTIQVGDSLAITYSVSDSNDAGQKAYLYVNSIRVDSVGIGQTSRYVYRGTSQSAFGVVPIKVEAVDPDDSAQLSFSLGVNHVPTLTSVSISGQTAYDGDTLRMAVGTDYRFIATVNDSDLWYGLDSMTYRFTTPGGSATSDSASYHLNFSRADSFVNIVVWDKYHAQDSITVFFKWPWVELDSLNNPGLVRAKKVLQSGVSLIVGSNKYDTIVLPYVNTGNDSLTITSLALAHPKRGWIQIGVPALSGSEYIMFDSLSKNSYRDSIVLAKADTGVFLVILNADLLHGDGYIRDTLFVYTSDPFHPVDTVPILLEYNDLPRIARVGATARAPIPFALRKTGANTLTHSVFPPYSKIVLTFSEPMDSASVAANVSCYSIFDSIAGNSITPIEFSFSWSVNYSVCELSPRYSAPNRGLNGLFPSVGFFIPTDSISLHLGSGMTDRAYSASLGPNRFDLHRTFAVVQSGDTTLMLRVDSVTFTVTSVNPSNQSKMPCGKQTIMLQFNAPLSKSSIDTNKSNNKSLRVTTRFGTTKILSFDSVRILGNAVWFYPAAAFYYGDSVTCVYKSKTGRDSLGYPIDYSGDGIPSALFDSLSTSDDIVWRFSIADLQVTSFEPQPNGSSPASAPQRITFSTLVQNGVIDTSLHNNRSMQVTSKFFGPSPQDFSRIVIRGATAEWYPTLRYYGPDTITCSLSALKIPDTVRFFTSFPSDTALSLPQPLTWRYTVTPLSITTTIPVKSGNSSLVRPEISLRFSDKLFAHTFDTSRASSNRSFTVTSRYRPFPHTFEYIRISSDSMGIVCKADSGFFAQDSISCVFHGFVTQYSYTSLDWQLPDSGAMATSASSWFFCSANVGFYTFPNPYKPGINSAHCGAFGAPCGIWFKNLHALKPEPLKNVSICIFSLLGNPVFDSKKAGVVIPVVAGDPNTLPQWKWGATNQNGVPVVAGPYFYCILDENNTLLIKGKILIVR